MFTPIPYRVGERMLTIDQVSVQYDRPILTSVSASIDNIIRDGMAQGQVVCLLGPSGIGKTQLLRCIAGLQSPASGQVRLGEKGACVQPGEVGLVAQHYPLLAHRTVLGNLLVAARRKSPQRTQAQARAMALLEKFGLAERALAYPGELSGGQRQRVAIAQQLLCSDHFLLMDEPFSGLDPHAKANVCDTILKVSTLDERNTTIVITHDIACALRIADTIWLLGRDPGADGPPPAGARICECIDLIARGLAWRPEARNGPEWHALECELEQRFSVL
jgi:ABC-type nitrate/sulfonate/bicarbonate transport system ATPase subunit